MISLPRLLIFNFSEKYSSQNDQQYSFIIKLVIGLSYLDSSNYLSYLQIKKHLKLKTQ